MERYEVAVGDGINVFPAQLTDLQKQVLELLEVPRAAYQQIRRHKRPAENQN